MASRSSDPNPRQLHDPSQTLHIRTLHHSPSVSVYDVGCRPLEFARGAEEWSLSHQIVFPRRGVFERETRGRKLLADPNQVLFFNRDESYRVAHPGGCGDDCTVFAFDDALVREAIAEWDPAWAEASSQLFRFAQVASEASVFCWQDGLRRALAQRGERLALDEAALQLLRALLESSYRRQGACPPRPGRGSASPATSRLHTEQVERTSLLLATRFSEDLSLDAIARAVHCSPFHLARLFRAARGLSIHQYRHRLRLREGLRRLSEGEANLSALALDLGFSSHSHLSDAFRQAFGLSPAQARAAPSAQWQREMSRILEVPRRSRT
jgi:AraC family transcriptional regulator